MELDSRQTSHLFAAGTVAFPISFPSIGTISLEPGKLELSRGGDRPDQQFVVVQEGWHGKQGVLRAMRVQDVPAIFFAGERENRDDPKSRFLFSTASRVENFENGEWFVNGEITTDKIVDRLNGLIKDRFITRASNARGIVFVPEDRPVLTQVISTAGDASYGPYQPRCAEC
jgi:hypothetical protein